MASEGKMQPLKSDNICQVCQSHRIMRGSSVLTWMTRPLDPSGVGVVLEAHAQCIGPYLLKNPSEWVCPMMHDPNQIDLMDALKESLREHKVLALTKAGL